MAGPIVTGAPLPTSLVARDDNVDAGCSQDPGFPSYQPSDLPPGITNENYDAAITAEEAQAAAVAEAAKEDRCKSHFNGSMWGRFGQS